MNPFPEREHSETLEQGDPNLHPELIDQVELGVNYKNKRGSNIYANLYYRNVNHLINRVNTVYNDTILNRVYSNVGRARVLGREMGAEYNLGKKLKLLIFSNYYYTIIQGSFDGHTINTDAHANTLNLNSTYRFSDTAFAQFNFNYISERITAQGEDSEFSSS